MCVFTNWDQNNETVTDALHKLNIHMRQAYLTHKFYQILEQCLQLCILDEAIVILKEPQQTCTVSILSIFYCKRQLFLTNQSK